MRLSRSDQRLAIRRSRRVRIRKTSCSLEPSRYRYWNALFITNPDTSAAVRGADADFSYETKMRSRWYATASGLGARRSGNWIRWPSYRANQSCQRISDISSRRREDTISRSSESKVMSPRSKAASCSAFKQSPFDGSRRPEASCAHGIMWLALRSERTVRSVTAHRSRYDAKTAFLKNCCPLRARIVLIDSVDSASGAISKFLSRISIDIELSRLRSIEPKTIGERRFSSEPHAREYSPKMRRSSTEEFCIPLRPVAMMDGSRLAKLASFSAIEPGLLVSSAASARIAGFFWSIAPNGIW